MSASDIADLRRWHRLAVRRALATGYDVIYVYSGTQPEHSAPLPVPPVQPAHRLLRRLGRQPGAFAGRSPGRYARGMRGPGPPSPVVLPSTKGSAMPESPRPRPSGRPPRRSIHLPDVWDLVLGSWELDSATSRFAEEAEREPRIAGLKRLSAKPVVGVGRFTSPDTMVHQVRAGILDMIGAARPSIADPFLPAKSRRDASTTYVSASAATSVSPVT